MAGQIASAQAEMSSNLDELRRAAMAGGDAGAFSQAENQLQSLSSLQRRIENASPATLSAIRWEVAASVGMAQAVAALARSSAAAAQNADALQTASAAARQTVQDFTRDFYEREIFDPYLKFQSAEDEEAYRKREAEYRREIEKATAEGTPEGNLRANRLAIAQLKDAGAHGADRSPDYQRAFNRLDGTEAALAAQIQTATPAKAVTATQTPDPLDAAGASVSIDPAILAQIRATGVVVADQSQQGHGLTTNAVTNANAAGRG